MDAWTLHAGMLTAEPSMTATIRPARRTLAQRLPVLLQLLSMEKARPNIACT